MDTPLSIGLSALLAAQKGIDSTGHNIANATTPNYSRRRVDLAAIPPGALGRLASGAGVSVARIEAIRDSFVERALLSQDTIAGGATRRAQFLSQVQSLFSTDPEANLGATIDGFFNSFDELARNPSGAAERSAVLTHAQNLATTFQDLDSRLRLVQQDLYPYALEVVGQVNTLAAQIAGLNLQIRDAVVASGTPHDLIDQRTTALRQLAELVPIHVTEDSLSRVDVRCGGMLLVAGDDTVELTAFANGPTLEIRVSGTDTTLQPTSGQLGALLELANTTLPHYLERLDTLAATLVREVNKCHATGVGRNGSFTALTSTNAASDPALALNAAGLPFQLEAGNLYVSVIEEASGDVAQSKIAFDPLTDSLAELAAALDGIDHLHASVASGLLHISAEAGYRVDFTNKVVTHPGNLGGAALALAGAVSLDANNIYTFTVDTSATAGGPGSTGIVGSTPWISDVAADPGNTYAGTVASAGAYTGASDTAYLIEIVTGGDLATATCRVSEDGGATWGSTLSLAGGTVDVYDDLNGSDLGVDATFGPGTFAAGDRFTINALVPTPGLRMVVTNAAGATVATLDVGADYQGGQPLRVPGGITVALAAGSLADGDTLSVELAADPDAQGLLAALGINTLLRGSSAGSIALEPAVAADPGLIAAARSDAPADNTNALRLAELQDELFESLGSDSLGGYYAQLISKVGLDTLMAERAEHSALLLREATESQRDAVSGVNQDEEAIRLIQYQQLYMFAARYIKTIDELVTTLLSI